jgi:large subunit ribosomal protein L22
MAEARAQKKNIMGSPRKMRLMLDLIRGKRVQEALSILHFAPNHASIVAEQTLRSAIANFQLKPQHSRYDVEDLVVKECFADGGAMLKRVLPAPMGRAFRVRKRSNHITIVIGDKPAQQNDRAGRKAEATKTLPAKKTAGPKGAAASETETKKPRTRKAAPKKDAATKGE